MSRNEIIKLAKYGEECLKDSFLSPDIKDKLLILAEEQFKSLINQYNENDMIPMVGYLYSRLAEVKYNQQDYGSAENYYVDALSNLIKPGDYCQDRAMAHIGLARTYMKLENYKAAREHFIRGIHVYDSLAMKDRIENLSSDLLSLDIKIEDTLPAKAINEKGEPTKCRNCGGSSFKMVRKDNKIVSYDCTTCTCRNVVILDKLELLTEFHH